MDVEPGLSGLNFGPGQSVTYHLEAADMRAFLAYNRYHGAQHRRMRHFALVTFAALSLYHALTYYQEVLPRFFSFCWIFAVYFVVFSLVSFLLRQMVYFRSWTSEKQPGLICEHTVTLADDAVVESTPVNEGRHRWAGIRQIGDTHRHIFIYVAENAAHIIPRRAFPSPENARGFLEKARELCARAKREK